MEGRRWIVNCGATGEIDSPLIDLTRATAAHSVAVLHDTSSAAFFTDGAERRMHALGAVNVKLYPAALAVDASHEGYAKRYGITHTRRLALSPDAGQLDGIDVFSGTAATGR